MSYKICDRLSTRLEHGDGTKLSARDGKINRKTPYRVSLNQERALTGRLCAIMRCNWSDLQRPQRAQIDCGPIHVNRLIKSLMKRYRAGATTNGAPCTPTIALCNAQAPASSPPIQSHDTHTMHDVCNHLKISPR